MVKEVSQSKVFSLYAYYRLTTVSKKGNSHDFKNRNLRLVSYIPLQGILRINTLTRFLEKVQKDTLKGRTCRIPKYITAPGISALQDAS